MTSGDDRRAMPPFDFSSDDASAGAASNPFKPVSMQNRITGSSRGNMQHTCRQPAPGNRYEFGDDRPGPFVPVPFSDSPQWVEPTPLGNTREAEAARHGAPYPPLAGEGYKNSPSQPFVPPDFSKPVWEPQYSTTQPLVPPPVYRADDSGRPAVTDRRAAVPFPAGREAPAAPGPESTGWKSGGAGCADGGLPPIRQISVNNGEDPWVALGWKAPDMPQDDEPALKEDYYNPPADTGPYSPGFPVNTGAYPPPFLADGATSPYPAPYPDEGFLEPYPPADNHFSQPYQAVEASPSGPYRPVTPEAVPVPEKGTSAGTARGGGSANGGGPPPKVPPSAGKTPPRGFRQTMKSSWRMVLLIACSLAVVFAVIEVARMVQSLMTNERQLSADRQKYYQLAGVDPDSTPESVELLEKGQTYAPTATPQAVQTPTPAPRIQQNDPLIGVLDAGGDAAGGEQTGQPATKTAQRTKLRQYPDNLLLSIDEAFADLREQNEDVVGRLVIDGVLDETLVQSNNTYYLTHNARRNRMEGGAVFVDEGCTLKTPPENLLLRGQTNVPGERFEPLTLYGTQGAGYVSSHGIVTCNTLYEKAEYVVFAVVYADSRVSSPDYFNYAGYPTFQTDAQMLGFVELARAHSVYNINVNVQASDRLLTLAALPADGETASWVILCRKLRSGETPGHIQTD